MNKVCILTSVHPHDDIRVFHRQAKTLRSAGYEVSLICPDYEGVLDGIRFIKVPMPQRRIQRMLSAPRLLYPAARRQNAQIFHLHDPELIPLGMRLKRAGFTVVYDIHEDYPLKMYDKTWLPTPLRRAAAFAVARAEQLACQKFALCIAATPQIAAKFAHCITVCNYPEESEFLRPHRPFADCQKQVTYVGAITQSRGAIPMVEAVQRSSANLALAGKFESIELYRQVMSMAPTPRVTYKGVLDRSEVGELLAQSCAGLLLLEPTTAYQQSMPIKLFEYMLAGVPVIASDFAYWRELAGEDCALYVNPQDADQIATAIESLVNNPDLCQHMGQAGRQRAQKHFTFKTQAQELIRHYHKLRQTGGKL